MLSFEGAAATSATGHLPSWRGAVGGLISRCRPCCHGLCDHGTLTQCECRMLSVNLGRRSQFKWKRHHFGKLRCYNHTAVDRACRCSRAKLDPYAARCKRLCLTSASVPPLLWQAAVLVLPQHVQLHNSCCEAHRGALCVQSARWSGGSAGRMFLVALPDRSHIVDGLRHPRARSYATGVGRGYCALCGHASSRR